LKKHATVLALRLIVELVALPFVLTGYFLSEARHISGAEITQGIILNDLDFLYCSSRSFIRIVAELSPLSSFPFTPAFMIGESHCSSCYRLKADKGQVHTAP